MSKTSRPVLFFGLISMILLGAGCSPATTPSGPTEPSGEATTQDAGGSDFVKLPGEPSRRSNDYYILEDICAQFTQGFIEKLSGKKFVQVGPSPYEGIYACRYYLEDPGPNLTGKYLSIQLEYLSVEKNKKGNELLGYQVNTDSRIPMDHHLTWKEDGTLIDVHLDLQPEKFLRIYSLGHPLTDEEMIVFASKLAAVIKDFK